MSTNTKYGTGALKNNTGSNNTAVGIFASFQNLGEFNNTSVGANAGFANAGGDNNTAVGAGSLCNNTTGALNTAVGSSALEGVVSQSVGNQNVAVGVQALYVNEGNMNTAVGSYAGISTTTGSGNTLVGANTTTSPTSSYATAVGYNAAATQSNTIVLGGQDPSGNYPNVLVPGDVGINNSNPQYALDVSGNINTNTGYIVSLSNPVTNSLAIGYVVNVSLNTATATTNVLGSYNGSASTSITNLPRGTWIMSGTAYLGGSTTASLFSINVNLPIGNVNSIYYSPGVSVTQFNLILMNQTFFYDGSSTLTALLSIGGANQNGTLSGALSFTRIA